MAFLMIWPDMAHNYGKSKRPPYTRSRNLTNQFGHAWALDNDTNSEVGIEITSFGVSSNTTDYLSRIYADFSL